MQSTQLTLGGPNNTYPGAVVNDGTLRLDADGSGTTTGGAAILTGDELDNNGTFESTVEDSSYSNQLLDTFVNESRRDRLGDGRDAAADSRDRNDEQRHNLGRPRSDLGRPGRIVHQQRQLRTADQQVRFGTLTMRGEPGRARHLNAGGTLAPTCSRLHARAGTEFQVILL